VQINKYKHDSLASTASFFQLTFGSQTLPAIHQLVF